MIVKNEEHILEKALASIAPIADEIIITDTGSTDSTLQIAEKYTKNIQHFPWIDDFSAARNFTDQFASQEYILRWDADWILRNGDLEKIQSLKKRDFNNADLVYWKWILEFEKNQPIRYQPLFFLYKRGRYHWELPIHNQLLKNNPRQQEKKLSDQQIWVFHHKDPVLKKERYQQTKQILSQTLSQSTPYKTLLSIHAIQGYLFDQEYNEAIRLIQSVLPQLNSFPLETQAYIIEKYCHALLAAKLEHQALRVIESQNPKLKNHPRIQLIEADITALTDIHTAAKKYRAYLKKPFRPDNILWDYDSERFLVHPRVMLGNIYLSNNKFEKGLKLIRQAKNVTNVSKTKRKLYFQIIKCTFLTLLHR